MPSPFVSMSQVEAVLLKKKLKPCVVAIVKTHLKTDPIFQPLKEEQNQNQNNKEKLEREGVVF
jgi:hypothetical protein